MESLLAEWDLVFALVNYATSYHTGDCSVVSSVVMPGGLFIYPDFVIPLSGFYLPILCHTTQWILFTLTLWWILFTLTVTPLSEFYLPLQCHTTLWILFTLTVSPPSGFYLPLQCHTTLWILFTLTLSPLR